MSNGSQRTISPTSFAVAPELLGLPLAGAGRRLMAMLVDLALVGMLVKIGGVLLGFAAAYALLRASARWTGRRTFSVLALRTTAAFILFVSIISAWGFWEKVPGWVGSRLSGGADGAPADTSPNFSLAEIGATAVEAIELNRARDAVHAEMLATQFVERLKARGIKREQLAGLRQELLESTPDEDSKVAISAAEPNSNVSISLNPLASKALQDAILAQDSSLLLGSADQRALQDSLVLQHSAALSAGDTARADSLRVALFTGLAGDSIRRMQRRIDRLAERNKELQEAQEEAGNKPVVATILGVLDDFGLGFGWLGLYFTAFLVLWRGQTPGKRIFGLRVLRLDGKPIGWWASFERFGGYTASVFTGLLGFAQIMWDRNRMALHDKIVETVVVVVPPVPAPPSITRTPPTVRPHVTPRPAPPPPPAG